MCRFQDFDFDRADLEVLALAEEHGSFLGALRCLGFDEDAAIVKAFEMAEGVEDQVADYGEVARPHMTAMSVIYGVLLGARLVDPVRAEA